MPDPAPLHLRDLPIPRLLQLLGGREPARRAALAVHRGIAPSLDALPAGRLLRRRLARGDLHLDPLARPAAERRAADGTRKFLFRLRDGAVVETVLIRNLKAVTLCVSSQVGCAVGCAFCATGRLGLRRNLSAGEITETVWRSQALGGVRVSDIVFMGQGEPLQSYDAVMTACDNLHHHLGAGISRRRISISTAGITPRIRRFTDERRPWRLYLSLHAAVEETRRALVPIARRYPLGDLLDAMADHQRRAGVPWLTIQYVAIPGVNMDDRHVDAIGHRLRALRYILDVIPYNEAGPGDPFRPPSWDEVRAFTARLRRLRCPVKIRYSAGKREGMGCGQLSADALATEARGGHLDAPPGIFTA